MKRSVLLSIGLLAVAIGSLSACATLHASPRAKLEEARASYEPVQIAIEGVVSSPTVDPDLKARLRLVDEEAMNALRAGRFALEEGRDEDAAFYTSLLRQALIRARTYIATSPEAENAGDPLSVPAVPAGQ